VFTGLIKDLGTIVSSRSRGGGLEIEVLPTGLRAVAEGESIAVNGVCLTLDTMHGARMVFSVSPETISRSHRSKWQKGRRVNLEPALSPTDRMGGHFVQGHVDGVGNVTGLKRGHFWTLTVEVPDPLLRYTVPKGSIAVDGISLTIAAIARSTLTFALIPHSIQATTLSDMKPTTPVHLEVDILAKYVERLLTHASD